MKLKFPPVKYLIGILAGGLAGFLYYRFVGCATGSCMITSNPYLSTIYGMVFGFLVSSLVPGKKKRQEE